MDSNNAPGSASFQRIPSSAQRPTRELKVEDALLYLDQVKMEFSDKPHIYNEFLDIMKNFKAQSINTPGVIERVKTLFKGHNKLILGFNTFLPEGEGYKIELTADEQEGVDPILVTQTIKPGNPSSISESDPSKATVVTTASNPVGSGAAPNVSTSVAAAPTPAPAAPSTSPPPGQLPGQMQQAHAFHYVTKIRDRFTNEPETYRSFLKILHTYQKEQKNIKEVLEQVSQLFADHADLLMEFTYFLPDAVQDQAKERLERAARESEARKSAKLQAQKQRKTSGPKAGALTGMPAAMMLGPGVPSTAGPGGMASMLHGDMNLAGNKRGRAALDSTAANSAFASSYAMQFAHGLDESQLSHFARLQQTGNKKQNLGAGMMGGGLPAGAMASQLGLPQQLHQQPQRKQRKSKNAQQQENMMLGNMMGMTDLMAGAAGGKLMGYNSASQQMMLNHLQQQSLLGMAGGRGGKGDASASKDLHISISSERRFFDQIKDVLVASSREAWPEFVKCLEFFIDDKINKDELLKLVEDVLHDHHDIFKEFQRLLDNRTDYQGNKEDMWFSVPLSEIDFAQCRKCTPSYRALPRDYPRPKCSERSGEEEKLLNDVWVSIPIGSEESSSFKHMRKNQYEEALFKCEDERFEIDMVIDSNMSTIRVLEPLAEEIAIWKSNVGNGKREGSGVAGMPRFSLQLEKRQLTTIHLNAISRIYGDHGEEILELLRKNPVGTVPVLLKRLKQKDQEWRRARHELNKHWKDVVEKNHYKSFDHRSFYFRQNDKKYLSTKPLVQEIINAAQTHAQTQINANDNSSSVAPSMGSSSQARPSISIMASLAASATSQQASDTSHNAGVHYSLQDEEYKALLAGMTPHMLLSYSHLDHLVHRDIHRIVCHASENILSNPNDKERISALWRDLLRIFFNLPPQYLYVPTPTAVPLAGFPDQKSSVTIAGEAWPAETKVITVYGSGVVKSFREEDGMYEVLLKFGTAFVQASAILGAEQLSSQALYAIGVSLDSAGKETIFNGAVASPTSTESSRRKDKSSAMTVTDPCKVFFGTQMCYVFFRLHHALFTRLCAARRLSQEQDSAILAKPQEILAQKELDLEDGAALRDRDEGLSRSADGTKKAVYPHFLGQVHALIEGSIDSNRFEDFCRGVLGNRSFVLYTLDKIVHQLIKHLQAMANDDTVNKLIGLFVYHQNRQQTASVDPVLYKNHVSHILSHTAEEIFRIQLLCPVEGIMAKSSEVAIQHLGSVHAVANLPGVSETSSSPPAATPSSSRSKAKRSSSAADASLAVPSSSTDKTRGKGEEEETEEELEVDEREGAEGDDEEAMDVEEEEEEEGVEEGKGRGNKEVSDDDEEEEDEEGEEEDEDQTDAGARKVVFSPRIRQ